MIGAGPFLRLNESADYILLEYFMSKRPMFACPSCGTQFDMTREYLEQYGGQETGCSSCGKAMTLPRSWEEFITAAEGTGRAPVLEYSGPRRKKKRGPAQHWAEGDLLVVEKGAELSPLCVLCGEDAPQPHIACTMRWSQSARDAPTANAELFMSLTDSTKMRVRLGLCAPHLARRRRNGLLGVLCAMLGVAVIVAGFGLEVMDYKQTMLVGGIVTIIAGLSWVAMSRRILEAVYVDRWTAKLSGASPAFLQKLPAREMRVRPPDESSAAFDEIR
jgi:hypothetical protein